MNADLVSLLVALVLSALVAAVTYPLAEAFIFSPSRANATDPSVSLELELVGSTEALILELVLERLADAHETLTLRRRPRTTANLQRSAVVERFYIQDFTGARQQGSSTGSAENTSDFVRLMSDSHTWATYPESSDSTGLVLIPS
jgi:hypothetical protein